MQDIYKVHTIVEQVLEEEPDTRNSDILLWLRICQKVNPIACALPFEKAIADRKALGFPKPDTVSRIRRKVQAENPDLRAVEEVEHGRFENYEIAKRYALEV